MEEFLANPVFRYFIFPIGSAVLGIAIKYVTRNDQYGSFTKEDIAIGLELMRTACLMFIVLTTDKAITLGSINKQLSTVLTTNPIDPVMASSLQAQALKLSGQLASTGWFIALMVLSLWSVSTIVRKWGWKSQSEMYPFTGIALPLAFGILALVAVMAGATR